MKTQYIFTITIDYFNGQVVKATRSALFEEGDPKLVEYRANELKTHQSGIGKVRIVRTYPEIDSTGKNLYEESRTWYGSGQYIWRGSILAIHEEINLGEALTSGYTVLRYMFDTIHNYWYIFEFDITECISSCRRDTVHGIIRNHDTDLLLGHIGYTNNIISGRLLSHEGMLTARIPGSKEPFDFVVKSEIVDAFLQRRKQEN
jgi:hypothetical protein